MSDDPAPLTRATEARETITSAEERFERWRRIAGAVLAPLALIAVYLLLAESSLTPEARKLSAILAAVALLWMTETLPLPVTGLLAAVLCVVLGVADEKTALQSFAHPLIFLFIGSFMLARAMTIHALDRRIALAFLSHPLIGGRPIRLLAGVGVVSAFLSMWISNTATTAMMLPIAVGILGALHQARVAQGSVPDAPMNARQWPFATAMMLMVAYSASIGGLGTPVGTPPNLIGIGFLREQLGVSISFVRWMMLCVPMVAAMGVALFALLYVLHPDRFRGAKQGTLELTSYLRDERTRLGSWTAGQRMTAIAFGVAILLWITPGVLDLPFLSTYASLATAKTWMTGHVPEASVALIAAILLFMLPIGRDPQTRSLRFTLTWPEAVRIDWGTVLLFGAGISLGNLMFSTGVAEALGDSLTEQLGIQSLWGLTAVSIALSIVLSEATSNTASATMMVPTVLTLAQSLGVDPIPPALGACIGASFGFMLPVSTAPNAIVYGSGLVSIPSMIRAGVLFDLLGFALIFGGLRLLYPILSSGF